MSGKKYSFLTYINKGETMENILDTKVPDTGTNVLKPSKYTPPPQPKTVNKQMTSWYNWLVRHVPEPVRIRVSAAYTKMKDKEMYLSKKNSRWNKFKREESQATRLHTLRFVTR